MDRKWQLASLRLLPKFSHRRARQTLRCSWQMRELSHLLTCGGVGEWPGRWGGRAVSTFLSRRWIAHAVAIYHWKERRGGGVDWMFSHPATLWSPSQSLKRQQSSQHPSVHWRRPVVASSSAVSVPAASLYYALSIFCLWFRTALQTVYPWINACLISFCGK